MSHEFISLLLVDTISVFYFQLDGWIARRFPSQKSAIGSFLDPLSDKILMTTMFLSLTYVHVIPAALTALVVSRDILLIYAGLYVRYMSVVPPVSIYD